MRVVAQLHDDLSNAQLEKRLAEDRAKAEIKQLREDAARQQEKSQLAELEPWSEIQVCSLYSVLVTTWTNKVPSEPRVQTRAPRARPEDLTSSNTVSQAPTSNRDLTNTIQSCERELADP
jgi:hypothetical protein